MKVHLDRDTFAGEMTEFGPWVWSLAATVLHMEGGATAKM